ncbi:MAG: lipid-A-disaccharide synthase [Deltaproteobacteria bacterium HGW-Deltaproteobacteria-6]|jgi:lipid-A-disaccharide synthase|nr:MAG: lipid-A-disaccharide synthase [Deltaproteobacteria bacterium HGW-Deltaproteobacteria-6]
MPPKEINPSPAETTGSRKTKTIMIVAGEASGDMHGAALVREMAGINPSLHFYGIGGSQMEKAGVTLLANNASMAVMGITEIVTKLGSILKTLSMMKKALDSNRPDLVILIDYADFNLRLARAAKKKDIKVFYYISPKVWAWRGGRIAQIKKFVDRMAVIFPFEVDTYAAHGYTVNYVGHPLVDMVKPHGTKQDSRKSIGVSANETTIALLPGSRLAEVNKLLPEMLLAAEIISQKIPGVQFVLPLADTLEEKIILDIGKNSPVKIKVIAGKTYDVIASADLAIVASGTATLETGLLGVPMIIIYKVSLFSELIARMFISIQHMGLVNIIAGKTIAPELIQSDVNGQRMASEALAILLNHEKKQEMIAELQDIRARMGEPGAAGRAAQIACDML